jgi:hypothetical protein
MLEHGFTGERDEGFTRKTGGGKPGRDYAQDSLWHELAYHKRGRGQLRDSKRIQQAQSLKSADWQRR